MKKIEGTRDRAFKAIKLILIIILFVVCVMGYTYYILRYIAANSFATQSTTFWADNSRNHFRVNQIMLYSSAYAEDKSGKIDMSDVSISQYTDIAIYIDNQSKTDGLSEDNTISELYIDNVSIETGQKNGSFSFGFKSPLDIGKYTKINDLNGKKLDYKIVHTNAEKSTDDNVIPTFFTDCSNPITLGYVNNNIIKHHKLTEESSSIANNGTMLKTTNVDIDKITPKISFDIHIKTNMNERYYRKMYLDIPLENSQGSITSGYLILLNRYTTNEYSFIKE